MCEEIDNADWDDDEASSPDIDDDLERFNFTCEARDWSKYSSNQLFNQFGVLHILVLDLSSDDEISAGSVQQMTNHFARNFAKRYPSSNLQFFAGSLDEALAQSIYNSDLVSIVCLLNYESRIFSSHVH